MPDSRHQYQTPYLLTVLYCTMWAWDTWGNPLFLLVMAAITFYLVYRAALPKPLAGIPHRADGARHVLGDLPALLRATAHSDLTHVQWIQQQLRDLGSPVMQIFMGPFARPIVIVADFREAQDILMRRREWDRSEMLAHLFGGLIPDHHSQYKTNALWKGRRRLLQDLMCPPFLHNVVAPALYANAANLISLWEKKATIAGTRPFSATEDIFRAALDAVHAFAYGEGFEYGATRTQLEFLEAMDTQDIQGLLGHGAASSSDDGEPVQFPTAKSHDLVDATLSLTEAVETVQGTPSMRLAWKLLQLQPRHRRAKQIRDACILRELERAVHHMSFPHGQGQYNAGESTSRVRSAVDYMVQRERQMAEKDRRAPEYFSPVMMTEVSDNKKLYKIGLDLNDCQLIMSCEADYYARIGIWICRDRTRHKQHNDTLGPQVSVG